MSAPAPKKAPPSVGGELADLMRQMGSNDGFDPIPPAQYLHFQGQGESPLQRLLALVRATTIRKGHRRAYCVDKNGKVLTLGDLERALKMDHGNFMRAWRDAEARGLIKRDQIPGSKSPRFGVFICGNPPESTSCDGGEEKARVCADTPLPLSAGDRKIVAGWPKEKQERFYDDFGFTVKYCNDLRADVERQRREFEDRLIDETRGRHGLPIRRKGVPPVAPTLARVDIFAFSSVSAQTRVGADTETRDEADTRILIDSENYQSQSVNSVEGSRSAARKDRPTDAATRQRKATETPQNGRGAPDGAGKPVTPAAPPANGHSAPEGELDAIAAMLRETLSEVLPGHTPGPNLCARIHAALNGAPLVLLKMRILGTAPRKFEPPRGTLGLVVQLAADVATAWRAGEAEREKQQAKRAAQEGAHEMTLDDARAVLADPGYVGTIAHGLATRIVKRAENSKTKGAHA